MAQHPRFESFKSAWQAADYAQALAHIDAVLAEHPHVASLHWYRANCLRKLERYPEALDAVNRVLALEPDHAPALVLQVQLDGADDAPAGEYDEDRQPTPAQFDALMRGAAERRQRHIAQLRRAMAIDPTLADACFVLAQALQYDDSVDLLSGGRAIDETAFRHDEARTLFERAIALAPERAEFRRAAAELYRLRALQVPDGTPDDACVVAFNGMKYLRAELEAALREYEICARLDPDPRHFLRMGSILHDLHRFDEALASYDRALQLMPADAPQREHVLQMRARSENDGAGERDDMANLLESLIAQGDRNLADDNMATALLGAARAVRQGKNLQTAVAARMPESPDDFVAANIAEQILNVAYENPPELVAVDSAEYPAYQRKYVARQRKALEAAGMRHAADAEAAGMTRTLGQRVLLGLHADASGGTGVGVYALAPKWPGLIGFLRLFVTGKWKTQRMTECITYFDDGGYLITQYENISPFTYGDAIDIERLPRGTSVAALVARHAQRVDAYARAHPRARPVPATDLAAAEANWRRGQAIKRAYRRSIGYVSDAELRTMLGAHYDRFADKVRSKLLELAADREERALDDA